MKPHLYKRSEGTDFIFSSEKEFPKQEDYYSEPGNIHTYDDEAFASEANHWLSTAEKVEVYPGEVEKFKVFMAKNGAILVPEILRQGVIIPECFYIDNSLTGDNPNGDWYAFFRSPEPDKPQENDQVKLWDEVDEHIGNRLPERPWQLRDAIIDLREKYEIKRK